MPVEIYIFHPGVGVNRPLDGALRARVDGANVGYLHQIYPEGADRQSFFHGIVLPPLLDTTVNMTVRTVWKQEDAGAGDVILDLGYRNFTPPAPRDVSLTLVGQATKAVPGTVGQEFIQTFTVPTASMASGEEIFFLVKRAGSLGLDSYNGAIALVRVDVEITQVGIEILDEGGSLTKQPKSIDFVGPGVTATEASDAVTVTIPGGGGGGGGGFTYYTGVTPIPDNIQTIFTVPTYSAGNLVVFRNGVIDKGATESSPTTFTLPVPPATGETLCVLYKP